MRANDEVLKRRRSPPPAAAFTGWKTACRTSGASAAGDSASGSGWIGLRSNGAYRVTALEQEKLLPQWLALLIIVGALLLAWRLEGR